MEIVLPGAEIIPHVLDYHPIQPGKCLVNTYREQERENL